MPKRIVNGHVLYTPVVTVVPGKLVFVSGILSRNGKGEIVGKGDKTFEIMTAIEQHLEVDAYRWGNACPETGERLTANGRGAWDCPACGGHTHMEPTELLIAFKPCEPST